MKNSIGFEGIGIDAFEVKRSFTLQDIFGNIQLPESIGSFQIYWYGVIITLGLILAVGFCLWQAKKFDLTTDNIIDVLLWGLPIGVICARAYYVLFKLEEYDSFAEMINIRDGGLAIYGGIIGAFFTGFLYCKIKKANLFALFDIASLGFLIGQSVGRWGNFVNAEAHGGLTKLPWGMTINGSGPYHPTFFYESLWNVLGFVLLLFFAKKWMKFHGETFFLYFAWYGLGRFFIEGLRTDSLMLGPMRISQILAVIFFLGGIAGFALSRKGLVLKIQNKLIGTTEKNTKEYKPIYAKQQDNETKEESDRG